MKLRDLSLLALATLLGAVGCASQAPTVTEDGLVLRSTPGSATLYVRPNAVIKGYEEFGLGACEVSFKRNWLRDQNSGRIDLSNRVTQKDVDRIKDTLAKECDTYLRGALEQEPAYRLVEQFTEGESVLIIRPAIVNLDVNAPDTNSATRQRNYTTSAGEMTLVLELIDATTGEVLARAYDRQGQRDTGFMQWSNSVTNKADADRILKVWATRLREGLDQALSGV
ncbi:MAG: DUF3313 family protein [Congregibacter sp.]